MVDTSLKVDLRAGAEIGKSERDLAEELPTGGRNEGRGQGHVPDPGLTPSRTGKTKQKNF